MLIDGHNLAHHLFDLKGSPRLNAALAGQLVHHIARYRAAFGSLAPNFEIFFDGGVHPIEPDPPGIRVMAAGPRNTADRVILERFRFHFHLQQACLAITNDQEILDKIEHEGGAVLSVYAFVRLASALYPQFLPPDDVLAALPKMRPAAPEPIPAIRLEVERAPAPSRAPRRKAPRPAPILPTAPAAPEPALAEIRATAALPTPPPPPWKPITTG